MVSANPHYMVWNCDDGFAQSSCVAVDLLEASDTEIRSRECRTNANLVVVLFVYYIHGWVLFSAEGLSLLGADDRLEHCSVIHGVARS